MNLSFRYFNFSQLYRYNTKSPVFKPFLSILRKVEKTKEAVRKQPPVVPVTGLEPVRILLRGILSPLCLPIPPHRRMAQNALFLKQIPCHRSEHQFTLNRGCGDPDENRTRVTAVKGRCLNRLTTGPLVAEIGLEPTTLRV